MAAGLTGERDDLVPRAAVALGRVEVGQPAVAPSRDALEDGVDVTPDQDRRARALDRPWQHARLAQIELVGLQRYAVVRPQARENVEVPLEEPPAALERDTHGVELARVPAGRQTEDEPALRDDVEGAERLGGHRRIPQREHQHPGAQLDAAGSRGDGRERTDGV